MKRFLNSTVVPWLAFLLVILISVTLRVRITGAEQMEYCRKNRYIIAFWHSRIFYMPYHFRFGKGLYALVSPSADGEIIAGILRLFGISSIRGSSFQHGRRALITLAKTVKKGGSAAMIADGSRGPANIAQPGSIYLAKLTGTPIIPITFGAEKKSNLNSWDRTLIPLPFSRINMVYGKPMIIPPDLSNDEIGKKQAELEAELNRLTAMADNFA